MRIFEIIESISTYDDEYQTLDDLLTGLQSGELLVHTRVEDGTSFEYGIDPSAGEFLRSTEAWQTAEEEYGSGPELTFFSDSLTWATSNIMSEVRGVPNRNLELIFVRKHNSIQKSLGNGKVETASGKVVPYEYSPMADYEDPLFNGEPAGVEPGDWYTKDSQDVVAVVPRELIMSRSS